MSKVLIILVLLLILAAIIAVRYRRQIQTGIYLFKMFRKMRQMGKSEDKVIEAKPAAKAGELVRCAKCGTWIPKGNALNLRSKIFYCSANCMEKAVETR